jgi:hypothetical protein
VTDVVPPAAQRSPSPLEEGDRSGGRSPSGGTPTPSSLREPKPSPQGGGEKILDPLTLAVIQAGLQQVCNEMDLAFSRAAFSP